MEKINLNIFIFIAIEWNEPTINSQHQTCKQSERNKKKQIHTLKYPTYTHIGDLISQNRQKSETA